MVGALQKSPVQSPGTSAPSCLTVAEHRTPGLMSASVPLARPCGSISLMCALLLASLPLLAAGRLFNCTHPLVPEHGGFRCDPSPCQGFHHKSIIRFFCEPGYHISTRVPVSSCRHGRWQPPIPACISVKASPSSHQFRLPLSSFTQSLSAGSLSGERGSGDGAMITKRGSMRNEDRVYDSMPSMATTAVGVSIFLLTTTACLVVKSRLYPCQSHSRRSSDQLDLMVDGLPVSLPSYEEAVYGSWGQRLPPCSSPGPTQLLLVQEVAACPPPDNPPPPYEEVQSSQHRACRPHSNKDT